MAGSHEDEIYSVMFSSLKHPIRRKILRMLANKPMSFMEMVEELGVSSPNLTYHLESLGELISKMDNDQYKLSAFGVATINAMKGIEEVREIEPKRRLMTFRWKVIFGVLMIAVILLASMAIYQNNAINNISTSQNTAMAENQQLLSWGIGSDKVANFLTNLTQIDTKNYTISLMGDTWQWRTDFGGVAEQVIQYSLKSSISDLNAYLRYRNNHFSRYELNMIESSPVYTQAQPNDVLQNAKYVLSRYWTYSGDSYLANMTNLLATVNTISDMNVTQGNMKLQITVSGDTDTFLWMYSQNGIDYQAKGLQMTFQNNVLVLMSDGYFLFTIGSTDRAVSQQQAIDKAVNYVKTLTYTIGNTPTSGFSVIEPPSSVQLTPHPRGNSLALIPYWYIEMSLTQTYAGGYNEVAVGIYADTGEVTDVQLLSTSAGTG
jgi:DNA-binding transcriptional ArsR family regulator